MSPALVVILCKNFYIKVYKVIIINLIRTILIILQTVKAILLFPVYYPIQIQGFFFPLMPHKNARVRKH